MFKSQGRKANTAAPNHRSSSPSVARKEPVANSTWRRIATAVPSIPLQAKLEVGALDVTLQRQPEGETGTHKVEAASVQEAVDSGDFTRAYELLNGQPMPTMLATLSGGNAVTIHMHRKEAAGVNLPRITVALSAVMFNTVSASLPGWSSLPADQKEAVCNYLERIRRSKATSPGKVGSLQVPSSRTWRYVIYEDSIKLHFTPAIPALRIGSIPWVTNNPGNLTVDPRKRDAQGRPLPPSTKVPWSLSGAIGKSFYAARQKYAIYETYEKGAAAIFPYLQKVHSGRTLESAIRAYVSVSGVTASCRAKYTNRLFRGKHWSGLTDSERNSVNNACLQDYITTVKQQLAQDLGKDKVSGIMSTKVSDISGKEVQKSVTSGIVEAEEGGVLAGVVYTCHGFTLPDVDGYLSNIATKKGVTTSAPGLVKLRAQLLGIINELSTSTDAEAALRKHLACPSKDDACFKSKP